MSDDRYERLKAVRDAVINLTDSPLYAYRQQMGYFPVIGQGSHHAQFMFIGEAPGENEAKRAIPFCGAAGGVLNELLQTIGLQREDVYITNIVKDRPPDNRDPLPEEIAQYAPFLYEQIKIIQPQVLVTLGRFSTEFILRTLQRPEHRQRISQLHGTVIPAQAQYGAVFVVPLFHPAMALYKPEVRQVIFQDFLVLRRFMED